MRETLECLLTAAFKRLSTAEPEVIRDCPSSNIKRDQPRQAYSKLYTAPYFKEQGKQFSGACHYN
jgi:hypothetical protein